MIDTNALSRQPLVNFETRCDDKGRIRLPANWLHFFTHDLNDHKVFATSLDGLSLRIYPESIWRANVTLLETIASSELEEDAAAADSALFNASRFGAETELDPNGRVLISTELRTVLALVGDLVVGRGKHGVIHIHRKADFDVMAAKHLAVAGSGMGRLTKAGVR